MATDRLEWEVLRSIDSTTFTGSYQNLGTPFEHAAYICKIINNSNALVFISNNGVDDKDVAPGNSHFVYDEGKVGISGQQPCLPKGTQISVRGAASGTNSGSVYLVLQYIIE